MVTGQHSYVDPERQRMQELEIFHEIQKPLLPAQYAVAGLQGTVQRTMEAIPTGNFYDMVKAPFSGTRQEIDRLNSVLQRQQSLLAQRQFGAPSNINNDFMSAFVLALSLVLFLGAMAISYLVWFDKTPQQREADMEGLINPIPERQGRKGRK